jgi:hypothetical protein
MALRAGGGGVLFVTHMASENQVWVWCCVGEMAKHAVGQ